MDANKTERADTGRENHDECSRTLTHVLITANGFGSWNVAWDALCSAATDDGVWWRVDGSPETGFQASSDTGCLNETLRIGPLGHRTSFEHHQTDGCDEGWVVVRWASGFIDFAAAGV